MKKTPLISGPRPRRSLSPGLLVVLSLLTAGCKLPGQPDSASRPVPADRILTFTTLYRQNCAGCHGADGKLGPAPPLNDPLFRALVPEKEVESVLRRGRKGTLMPAFLKENGGPLTAAQIQVLVNEIKGIPYQTVEKYEGGEAKIKVVPDVKGTSPQWGSPRQPQVPGKKAAPPPSYWPGETPGDEKRGEKLFALACATCHGAKGQGADQAGAIDNPIFLELISDQALRRIIITGRRDLGMPNYQGVDWRSPKFKPLTSQDVSDLVALLASWRQEKSFRGK
jgi:mono/diheme cytochrome c family protein